MTGRKDGLESILDLNSDNVWTVNEHDVAKLWHWSTGLPAFRGNEWKFRNLLSRAFDVETFDSEDEREKKRYADMNFLIFSDGPKSKTSIAIRKKHIRRVTDLSYENIKHISAAQLIELLGNNFGGGWDSISLAQRDIIESAFDISTTMLPTDRLHLAGGTRDKKIADGYEVLEVPKGTWTEAIFAKKKDPVEKLRFVPETTDEENLDDEEDEEDEENGEDVGKTTRRQDLDVAEDEEDAETEADDDTFYGTYIPEADLKDDDADPIDE